MKKRGFTLLELLAVIVILAVVAVITFPIVVNIVNDVKRTSKIRSAEAIIKSAKNYYANSALKGTLVDKTFNFDEGKPNELEYDGQSPNSGILKMNKDGNISIAFVYEKWCLTKGNIDKVISIKNYERNLCLLPETLNDPVITLIGEEIITLKQNEEYIELGADAKTLDEKILEYVIEIKLNDMVVENIDTSEYGLEYIIIYKTESNEKEAETIRKVLIIDGIPPEITFEENTTINVDEVLNFNLLTGVTVTDNSGIDPTITVTGSLSAIPGNYIIIYEATDQTGNFITKERTIIVIDGEFNMNKGVNKPVVVDGMKPVKWDSNNNLILTHENDPEWYNYSNKRWANVALLDSTVRDSYNVGDYIDESKVLAYFVWIPRYAYKITNGYSTNTSSGTIDIKFLQGETNQAMDETVIESSGYDSQTKNTSMHYFSHPAFNGDSTLGFWVGKFEPSGSSSNINILPNGTAIRSRYINDLFNYSIAMKNNSRYGWDSSKVDTHMITNYEWGAVAYLTQSNFGKEGEVWNNPSKNFTTGCAGTSSTTTSQSGCPHTYKTSNGLNTSTTGNITGIYDLVGGAWEYVAAYINNGHRNLTTDYGKSLYEADEKYKNVYAKGSTDNQQRNYEANRNMYGDAIYETSSTYNSSSGSWNGDHAIMAYTSGPFIFRGGSYEYGSTGGIFAFDSREGLIAYSDYSFRITLNAFK